MSPAVEYRLDAGVARIILAAPRHGNALDALLIEALHELVTRAAADPACRIIVLSADGPHFCSGLDLDALVVGAGGAPRLCRLYLECLFLLATTPQPVIASVHGRTLGGGVGLVAACDLVQAAEEALFQLPEVIVGMIPALVTPFLLRRLSPARLRYLALSTRAITAREAGAFGLVDEVVTDGLQRAVERQLQRLLRSSPPALAEIKRYFAARDAARLRRGMEQAFDRLIAWLDRPEVIDGIRTFSAGFAPPWFQKHGKQSAV